MLPFARNKGAQEFGALGTCWGSYMVIRESSYPEVRLVLTIMQCRHVELTNAGTT